MILGKIWRWVRLRSERSGVSTESICSRFMNSRQAISEYVKSVVREPVVWHLSICNEAAIHNYHGQYRVSSYVMRPTPYSGGIL